MKKEGLDRHKVCMPALGRHFLLGDFYNYRTEHRVIAGKLFFFKVSLMFNYWIFRKSLLSYDVVGIRP